MSSANLVYSKHSTAEQIKVGKTDKALALYPTLLPGIADHWPIQRWLSRAESIRREDSDKDTDSDAWLGAWLRDSLHSADRLARNQVLHCLQLYSCRS